jgi:hypothetical protein
MFTEDELRMMALGRGGATFMIDKRNVGSLAIGFGLVATNMIEVVGEHAVDDKPEVYWLAKLTEEGARVVAEHTL